MLNSREAELLAVYGRRRVGKTFLIRNVFEQQLVFEFSGMHHTTIDQQLQNFAIQLSKSSGAKLAKPEGWIEAFEMFTNYLTPIIKRKKKVIFIDEFPWIHTLRSGFLPAFENFWNVWASKQKNLVVVICGSAAAWMIQKVINNKGGLHNRVTKKMLLLPFTLGETELFLKERKVNLDRYQLIQLYMVMGGVPQYLKEVEVGESANQVINRIAFTKNGFLHNEFNNLFKSLFNDSINHTKIIKELGKKGAGLSRNEIIKDCSFSSGGGVTQLLEELTASGFITPFIPFGKNAKDSIYQLTDEFSYFYVKFIENQKFYGDGTWEKFSMGASWKIWSGFAFERICKKHLVQLKKEIGIENVHTEVSMWNYKGLKGADGAQIDLIIDRSDHCINICEMKFSSAPFIINKAYSNELKNKLDLFRNKTNSRKTFFLTMISTFGVANNEYKTGLVQRDLTMDFLFVK